MPSSSEEERRIRNWEREQRELAERQEKGLCACGHLIAQCKPEVCRSPLAQDAMWGRS
jgi:hypothetical protein